MRKKLEELFPSLDLDGGKLMIAPILIASLIACIAMIFVAVGDRVGLAYGDRLKVAPPARDTGPE